MKPGATQFDPSDTRRMMLLACVVVLLAVAGVTMHRMVAARRLRSDSQATALAWVTSLVQNADDIAAMIAGQPPSDKTTHLLKLACDAGKMYRFKLWDRQGRLVFLSDQMGPPPAPMTIAERHGSEVQNAILSGRPFTEAGKGKAPENSAYFAEAYVPVLQDGSVVGVFEAYRDETAQEAIYARALLLTESTIVLMVLLAGGIPGWMIYRKMRDHRDLKVEALFLAEHDSLTGISNRKRLEEAAENALAGSRGDKGELALFLIDLDRFKDINDNFGHGKGDEVLKGFALRLNSMIRSGDVAARLGGDEFVLLQVGVKQPSGAKALASRLLPLLMKPYDLGGSIITCGASIGVSIAPVDASGLDQLMSCADAALYKSKANGRNMVCFFEPGMDAALRERRQLEIDLRLALDTKAFQLAYQPLFSFHDGSLVGFEALLRWPDGWSSRAPIAFIPVAEESGLIVPIGTWVLETACRTAAAWTRPLKIAVNLSPIQFFHGDIVVVVRDALAASGLDAEFLELEVTESLWIKSSNAVLGQLRKIRSMGISISLDDFGTGYSSLTYLWKFPFDKVKIDQSFVREMQHDPKAVAIVKTIVAMGKTLGLVVLAEGIENEIQASALQEAGCDQAQGYWYGRPLTLEMANQLVDAQPPAKDVLMKSTPN